MKLPFVSREQLVVGVDIGSHAVKVCEFRKTDKGYHVLALGSAVIPEGAVDDGTLEDPEKVGEIIADLFKNLNIKNKKVGFSISGYSVIVKKVNLAVMDDEQLEEYLMLEAEQYIPFDISDVYLDFQDLKTNTPENDRTDVMLVAAKKDIVDDYLEMLRNINLQPVIVDVDGFALENTYETNYEKSDNVALVDIGGGTTDLAVFYEGTIRHTCEIGLGGHNLTNDLSMGLRTPLQEAERLKEDYGSAIASFIKPNLVVDVPTVGDREPRKITQKVLVDIIQARIVEILEVVNRELIASGMKNRINGGLVITGGTALLADIVELAEQIFDLQVRIGYPVGVG